MSLPTRFQVNKTSRKPLVFPLVCCQSNSAEISTNTAWLPPPDHTCSRALLRILPEKRGTNTDDTKGSVAGSLLSLWQPPRAEGSSCESLASPGSENSNPTSEMPPRLTPTALLTTENANQDSRQSIHYLQRRGTSLAVLEMWTKQCPGWQITAQTNSSCPNLEIIQSLISTPA